MSDRLILCVKPNNSPKGTLISGVDFLSLPFGLTPPCIVIPCG